MEVVQLLVGTQGVHVGIDAAARGDAEFGELQALPFRERMDYLRLLLIETEHGEPDGTLHAVQVVVDTRSGENGHRRRHAQQGELGGKVVLEHVFDGLDGLFGLLGTAEEVPIAGREIK